jgi:hypothetical protein
MDCTVHFRTRYPENDHTRFLTFGSGVRLSTVEHAIWRCFATWHSICSDAICKTLDLGKAGNAEFHPGLFQDGGPMAKVERIREVVTGSVDLEYVRQKTEAGWKLVAMEWRREIAGDETEQPIIVEAIPYGLRVASDCSRLEEDPQERTVLVQMMDLIVQDYSITLVASELNKRGLHTRSGRPWTPVSVFKMLPRLIEVGPHIFSSDDWEERRERLLKMV